MIHLVALLTSITPATTTNLIWIHWDNDKAEHATLEYSESKPRKRPSILMEPMGSRHFDVEENRQLCQLPLDSSYEGIVIECNDKTFVKFMKFESGKKYHLTKTGKGPVTGFCIDNGSRGYAIFEATPLEDPNLNRPLADIFATISERKKKTL